MANTKEKSLHKINSSITWLTICLCVLSFVLFYFGKTNSFVSTVYYIYSEIFYYLVFITPILAFVISCVKDKKSREDQGNAFISLSVLMTFFAEALWRISCSMNFVPMWIFTSPSFVIMIMMWTSSGKIIAKIKQETESQSKFKISRSLIICASILAITALLAIVYRTKSEASFCYCLGLLGISFAVCLINTSYENDDLFRLVLILINISAICISFTEISVSQKYTPSCLKNILQTCAYITVIFYSTKGRK